MDRAARPPRDRTDRRPWCRATRVRLLRRADLGGRLACTYPYVLSEDFSDGRTIDGVTFVNPFAEGFDLEALLA